MIEAFLDCIPPTVTAQQKRWRCVNGIPMAYDKPEVKKAKALYTALLTPYRPKEPLTGPIHAYVKIVFPWRKTEKKTYLKGPYRLHDKGSPDLDNIEKALFDVMEKVGFYKNDGQISIKQTIKVWGPKAGIHFRLKEAVEDWRQ